MPPPHPYTWAPNYTCDQPGVEAVLRSAVERMGNVHAATGLELVDARDEGARVAFELRDAAGQRRSHTADYLVGCDGASSTVRRLMGVEIASLDYDEPWIVVDLKVDAAVLARLPATNVQYCEPARPCTYIVCPGNHRRWEFMLLDGEPRDGALTPERLWELLGRWVAPDEASIWRAASYRFHALIAHDWRRGRMLLAGDSAHQTPPFLGQGMCQGLRDAGNLAWKLDTVIRSHARQGLLDTYTQERRPHVAATTQMAKQLGLMLSERDPPSATARDERMLASGGGKALTVIRQDLIPGLAGGLLDPHSPMAGQPFPQPLVQWGANEDILMDDVLGPCFRLIVDGCGITQTLRLAAQTHAIPVVVVVDPEVMRGLTVEPEDCLVLEREGMIRRWFAAAGVCGALVRPDHYVYGTFNTAAEAAALMDAVGLGLCAEQPPVNAVQRWVQKASLDAQVGRP
jgi:3-(3-hydroxy-phenyl)propionate hydroxylase